MTFGRHVIANWLCVMGNKILCWHISMTSRRLPTKEIYKQSNAFKGYRVMKLYN